MRNRCLKNLSKIEFVITYACTGRCKHCSEGDHKTCDEHIDPILASDAVRKIASLYDVKTVMAFGGEPLLYPDAVESIMRTASELNIPKRQIITNGYFTKDLEQIRKTAERIARCGVNDLLLSVDAFHQETIPLEAVKIFASELKGYGVPTRLQPAWLVSRDDANPYNLKTRELLDSFADIGIPIGDGNVIFPEGNARKFLAEYFTDVIPENPYEEDPIDLHCLSFSPNGDLLGGNIYRQNVMEILEKYDPKNI